MARFQFRLETLLKLRRSEQHDRQRRLSEAEEAIRRLAMQYEDLRKHQIALQQDTRQLAAPGPLNVDLLVQAQRYESVLQVQCRALEQQIALIRTERDRRHEALVAASRDVRTLEKHRDRLREKHRHEQLRKEMQQHDETAGQREAVRRQREKRCSA